MTIGVLTNLKKENCNDYLDYMFKYAETEQFNKLTNIPISNYFYIRAAIEDKLGIKLSVAETRTLVNSELRKGFITLKQSNDNMSIKGTT